MKNFEKINEIKLFFKSDGLLEFKGLPESYSDVVFIHDYELAIELARNQYFDEERFSKNQQCWRDIIEKNEGEIVTFAFDEDEESLVKIGDDVDQLTKVIAENLENKGFLEISEDVVSDVISICRAAAFPKKPEAAFFDLLYKYYCFGFWPCGWIGEFPAGKMCVYYPYVNTGRIQK